MSDEEIWRPIVGLEGRYEVSNLGGTRNAKTLKPIKQFFSGKYMMIPIRTDRVSKNYSVHREVARAFIGIQEGQVHHKNEDRKDNRLKNLCYLSGRDNVRDYHKKRRSLPTGVYFNKRLRCYEAYITKGKKQHYLGLYDCPEKAHDSYLMCLDVIESGIEDYTKMFEQIKKDNAR